MRTAHAVFKIVSVATISMGILSCATYAPRHDSIAMVSADLSARVLSKTDEAVTISLVPLWYSSAADEYLGLNPQKCKMLPLLLKIDNGSNQAVKADISKARLVTSSGQILQVLSIDEAVRRALRGDAEVIGWAIGFGAMGAALSAQSVGETNRSLEIDYHAKSFKPTMLSAGSKGEGIVFCEYSPFQSDPPTSFVVPLRDVGTNESKEVTVQIALPLDSETDQRHEREGKK